MRALPVWGWWVLVWLLTGSSWAQEADPDPIKTGPTAAPKLPADAFFYATINVKEIIALPALRLVPWEIFSGSAIDSWGIDPLACERLDVVVGLLPPDSLTRRLQFVVVGRTQQTFKLTPELLERLSEQDVSLVKLNERFVLLGDYDYMKRMVNEPAAEGELKRQVARLGDKALAWCVLVTEPIKESLMEWREQVPEEVKNDMTTLLTKTKLLAARYDWSTGSVPLLVETASADDAQQVEQAIEALRRASDHESLQRLAAAAEGFPERIAAALKQFHGRFSQEYQDVLTPKRIGARLIYTLDQDFVEVSQMGANVTITSAVLQALESKR